MAVDCITTMEISAECDVIHASHCHATWKLARAIQAYVQPCSNALSSALWVQSEAPSIQGPSLTADDSIPKASIEEQLPADA